MSGTKKPKNKFVHEKPTGTILTWLVFLFSNVTNAKAIILNELTIMIIFAIKKAFINYFKLSGRSSRSEFWYFFLFVIIMSSITTFIDTYIIGYHSEELGTTGKIFLISTIIPQLSIAIRRLHDVGKSGWWLLLSFTIIGLIPLLIWYCTMSDPRKNKYGAIPKLLTDFTK
ncbi:MAG: hypothetical protein CMI85_00140 [Candidatus Pelagibacter sp.]|nr:hypothetical protein [Candidatus Pelagibacter sp.]